jgi:hypothetical protein
MTGATTGIHSTPSATSLAGDEEGQAQVASVDGAYPGVSGYVRLSELVWPAFHEWLTEIKKAAAARLFPDLANGSR